VSIELPRWLPSLAMDFDRLTIILLERRSDAAEMPPEQLDALQDAHMAHLADLHEAGHLLAERDPAVLAGMFRIIALPWMVPTGAMTFTPTRFPRSMSEAAGS
jgi:uncharacterized protein